MLWLRKTRKGGGDEVKEDAQGNRCQMASSQSVLTRDLQRGVQHGGIENPKINQKDKFNPRYRIRKLESCDLIRAKCRTFHTTFLPQQKDTVSTYTLRHTASHTHYVVLAAAKDARLLTCQILVRMWRLSPASGLREKRLRDSKFKLLITVRHLNSTDIRKSSISFNFHSASILEHKSNYHGHKLYRLPHILGTWRNLSPCNESPHLLDIWAFDYILNSVVSTDGSA